MRYLIVVGSAGLAVWALCTSQAFGQALTVQQPQFDFFGVGTSVSVPDRGRMFLGGIDQSAHGRAFGPFRSAYGIGSEVSASRSDVSVWILDQQEMDRAVLGAAGRGGAGASFVRGPDDHAGRAMQYLVTRPSGRATSHQPRVSADGSNPAEVDLDAMVARGRQYEAEGRLELALAYYRSAARLGCEQAAARLHALGRD